MRELRMSGSVRGVPSNGHPYRDPHRPKPNTVREARRLRGGAGEFKQVAGRMRGRSLICLEAGFFRRPDRTAGVAGQVAALPPPEPGQSAGLSVFTSLRHSPDTPARATSPLAADA